VIAFTEHKPAGNEAGSPLVIFGAALASVRGNVFLRNAVDHRANPGPNARTGAHRTRFVRGVEDEVWQITSVATAHVFQRFQLDVFNARARSLHAVAGATDDHFAFAHQAGDDRADGIVTAVTGKSDIGAFAGDALHGHAGSVLLRKIAVARFTRTLGTLITSGVPILEGLAITARTSGNAVLEEALMKVRKAIEEGRTIVDPLRECGVFPNMVTQMIGVGEATGAMDAMLQKIADFYEDEVDSATKDMLAMLEPVIIGVLGVSIGGIVISLYMPLFAMIGKLAG